MRDRGPDIRLHDRRHAHAQHLADAGVHPKAISERLGHASVAFTIDTYTHPSLCLQREAVEAFSRTMWNPDAGSGEHL